MDSIGVSLQINWSPKYFSTSVARVLLKFTIVVIKYKNFDNLHNILFKLFIKNLRNRYLMLYNGIKALYI